MNFSILSMFESILSNDGNINVGLLERYLMQMPEKLLRLSVRIVLALVVCFIGIKIIKWIRKILKIALEKRNADLGLIQFLDAFVKVSLYFVLVLMIASGFGLEAASIIAVLGSAGIAVGLAVQGSLSNFAGGVLILLLKPFKVGDYIIEDSNKNEGTVIEISLFYTKLMTFDGKVIVLPNGALANNSMTNVTGSDQRKIDIKVSIPYQADIQKAREIILHLLEEEPNIRQNDEKLVYVHELSENSVILGIRCFVDNDVFWQTKWSLTEKVKYALEEQDIKIPYPQIDVHLKKE